MKNIALIMRRELGAYLRTPMGYVIAGIVLFITGLLFNLRALGGNPKFSAMVLKDFFAVYVFMSTVACVLLSMRLIAEEKQIGTLTVLLTSPVKEHEIVLGKFFSALLFFTAINALSLYMPFLIFVNGKVSIGHIIGGYLGLTLLGAFSLAVGMFASALAPSQIVAIVAGGAMMTAIWLLEWGVGVTESPIKELIAYISPWRHLQWQTGVMHSKDIFYFLSGTYLFLLLTTHVMKARRWR